jgi:hypothetical protein
MRNVTTLLIVLTLTGSPAANAMCVSWCASRPISAGMVCDGDVAEPASSPTMSNNSACAALLAEPPFLREEGRASFHAPAPISALDTPTPVARERAQAAVIGRDWEDRDAWPGAAARVLRL